MLEFVFSITTLLFLLFFFLETGRDKRVLLISMVWMALIGGLAFLDFFKNTTTTPPRFLLVMIGNLVFIIYFYKKLKTNSLRTGLNLNYVLIIHALRIPVELILYELYIKKLIPKIMTFNGLNFDILIGSSALILFVLIKVFKQNIPLKILLIWNWIGIVFLLNIVIIAILSAPLPIQQLAFEQPNIGVLHYPFILLPSFIVPVVFLTHLISIHQLNLKLKKD